MRNATDENRPLNVSTQGNRRAFIGLSWNPNIQKPSLPQRIWRILTGRKPYHDLDLSCFIFDKKKNLLDIISAKAGNIGDHTVGIYHSGDDIEGIGGGDDEQISVELKNLPKAIHHIVFKASVESGHSFDEVDTPEIRLVDAYTGRTLIQKPLTAGSPETEYIFCELYKGKVNDEWMLNEINQFSSTFILTDQ